MDNYPAGAANDPHAPYNEVEAPEREFELEVTTSLERIASVFSNDYEDGFIDEEGFVEPAKLLGDKKELFNEYHYSVTELLAKMVELIDEKLSIKTEAYDNLKESSKESEFCANVAKKFASEIKYYKNLKQEALAWTNEDLDL